MDVIVNLEQGLVFNPLRDILHLFPRAVQSVAHCFDQEYWPELWDMLRRLYRMEMGDTADNQSLDSRIEEDLISAMKAFVRLIRASTEGSTPEETFKQAEERTGWSAIPSQARFGYLAMLGLVLMALFRRHARLIYPEKLPIGGIVSKLDTIVDEALAGRRLATGRLLVDDVRTDLKRLVLLGLQEGMSREEMLAIVGGTNDAR